MVLLLVALQMQCEPIRIPCAISIQYKTASWMTARPTRFVL